MLDDAVDVEVIEHGVGILGQRRGKHNDFVDLAHRFQECWFGRTGGAGGLVHQARGISLQVRQRGGGEDAPSTPGRLIT